jgi:hypothetical protein
MSKPQCVDTCTSNVSLETPTHHALPVKIDAITVDKNVYSVRLSVTLKASMHDAFIVSGGWAMIHLRLCPP